MNTAEEAFLKATVGMLAYTLHEVTACIGALNAAAVQSPEIEQSMNELHPLMASVMESFPPPHEVFQ